MWIHILFFLVECEGCEGEGRGGISHAGSWRLPIWDLWHHEALLGKGPQNATFISQAQRESTGWAEQTGVLTTCSPFTLLLSL